MFALCFIKLKISTFWNNFVASTQLDSQIVCWPCCWILKVIEPDWFSITAFRWWRYIFCNSSISGRCHVCYNSSIWVIGYPPDIELVFVTEYFSCQMTSIVRDCCSETILSRLMFFWVLIHRFQTSIGIHLFFHGALNWSLGTFNGSIAIQTHFKLIKFIHLSYIQFM